MAADPASDQGHQRDSPGHSSGQAAAHYRRHARRDGAWPVWTGHPTVQGCGPLHSKVVSCAAGWDQAACEDTPTAPPNVTYKDLFIRFILLGWIAFGGLPPI